MPKQAKGHVRWVNGAAIARIRITGELRVSFPLPNCSTEREATERSELLATLAKRMRAAQMEPEQARKDLALVAAAAGGRALKNTVEVVNDHLGGWQLADVGPAAPTFKSIGEDWTSGRLALRYPDQIRKKRTVAEDIGRLTTYVYPVLEDTPIDRVTLDQCEEVMRRLPTKLATPTRRNIGHMMVKILRMAVYPLRLIERSPIPPGFLPGASKRKALAYLYPTEDARLMACTPVPLEWRVLWGFLSREGMREGEAIELTWADLDLERGAVRLDRNKTDDPRAWALNPGVAAALRIYREHFQPDAEQDDRVFLDPLGRTLDKPGLAELLRSHLRAIGLEQERPELFTTTAERLRIRVHDLRGTFVTLELAAGRSESWIADRTGHRSSTMINHYKRTARTFAELQSGELEPLDQAIPELRLATDWPRGDVSMRNKWRPQRDLNSRPGSPNYPEPLKSAEKGPSADLSSPVQIDSCGQSVANGEESPDAVETALADALTRASQAGQWDIVASLAAELQARRQARANVLSLDAARSKRGGGR